jgi:hypothetical protein
MNRAADRAVESRSVEAASSEWFTFLPAAECAGKNRAAGG